MSLKLRTCIRNSLGALSFVAVCSAADIIAATSSRQAILGSAYNSKKQEFAGQSCIAGNSVPTGTATGTFSFDQSLSESQASQQLGFGAGGRARFGAVEASASAQFMRNAASSAYSLSSVWVSEYKLPTQKLNAPKPNEIGRALAQNGDRWVETCGDEYVGEITYGARLFFSIRVDFSSTEEKQSFQAQFALSGPLFSANANLQQASQQFSKNAKVTVSALQFGGDVSKVTGLFADGDAGRAGFVQCTLGSFSSCADVISAALKYATSTTTGFPSQIAPGAKPGAAPLLYKTIEYKAAGIYPSKYPFLDQANQQARERLHGFFEKQFSLSVLTDRIISIGLSPDKLKDLLVLRQVIDKNIASILNASKTCYESPLQCVGAVQQLSMAAVNESLLVLPALPTAEYRLVTTTKGVWSREESVKVMMASMVDVKSMYDDCAKKNPGRSLSRDTCADLLVVSSSQRSTSSTVKGVSTKSDTFETVRTQPESLNKVAGNEGASVALQIIGVALREAALYFENRLIKKIPLTRESGTYPDKISFDRALIIVQTNRGNPGWLDVDLDAARSESVAEMPKADGIFYINVTDGFGRTTRFDVEYSKWEHVETTGDGTTQLKETWIRRNRWWATKSDGTKVTGAGDWTYDANGKTESSR